jgi:two-component system, NarL family, response regulator DevR
MPGTLGLKQRVFDGGKLTSMRKIRIAVIDDHESVRQGLRLSLDVEPDLSVVGEASTRAEAIEVAKKCRPDVALLDLRFGGNRGPEVCRLLLGAVPETAVIMLTDYAQEDLVFRSLVAGAEGCFVKDVEVDQLKRMIRVAYREPRRARAEGGVAG